MAKYFIDTETTSLHGMAVLLQYAIDDGPITLHSIWTSPVYETLRLIEDICNNEIIGFNLAFDFFHLCKIYTILSLLPNYDVYPEDHIEEIAELEPLGRDGPCLRPKAACDIMLVARRGPYQSTMDRRDIKIKRIPSRIVFDVAKYLEEKIHLDDLYFARRKDKYAPRWQVTDTKDPDFKDVVLKFKASSALKNLVIHALKLNPAEVLRFGDIEVPRAFWPLDVGYAPYAKALTSARKRWRVVIKKKNSKKIGYAWPAYIYRHISHWVSNPLARQYAEDDVKYTRELWKYFSEPTPGDDNSELACMVGAVRWRGFKINIEGIERLKAQALEKIKTTPMASGPVQRYITEVLAEEEKIVLTVNDKITTKKTVLEEIATWQDICPNCSINAEEPLEQYFIIVDNKAVCPQCLGTGTIKHPAAIRAQEVLDARQAKSEVDLYDKLLTAGRFHASFAVIGTLSNRMSGSGGDLNPQGIKRAKEVRSQFPLCFDNYILCGGDFVSFEVVIADSVWKDQALHEALQNGKSIHAIFGTFVYPGMTYDEVRANKEKYTRSKSAVFAMIYGGEAHTLKTRLGVNLEDAEKAYQLFIKKFPNVGKERRKIFDQFCSMRQAGGIGTQVEWHQPSDYIESIFGFRRYFTLENQICHALFCLANSPPKAWRAYKGKVTRRDREQTVAGAVQSALYAAAFAIQSSNMRAAANHIIQSSGAEITKRVQRKIWDLQPVGVGDWVVQPMNIHDEIMCPTVPSKIDDVATIVKTTVESYRDRVPLLDIEWGSSLASWADK